MTLAHAVLVATGSTGSTGSTNGLLSSLPLLIIFGLIFYFLLIRPQRRRAKQAQQTTSELVPGVEILTRHGQYATVVAVDEDGGLTLEVAPGVHSRFVKEAVARVITPQEPEFASDTPGGPPAIEMIPDSDGDGASASDLPPDPMGDAGATGSGSDAAADLTTAEPEASGTEPPVTPPATWSQPWRAAAEGSTPASAGTESAGSADGIAGDPSTASSSDADRDGETS